jgi:hypothetical protein
MPFQNPVVGGTALRIPAIQSPNYAPGVDGWIIKIDGSAEFNDLTVRGQFQGTDFIINSAGIFLYSAAPATGNLIGSWTSAAGTDAYGNSYQAGLSIYSADGTINLNDTVATWTANGGSVISLGVGGAQALMELTPGTVGGVTWQPGGLGTNITSDSGANTPSAFLQSPSTSTHTSKALIEVEGGSPSSNSTLIRLVATLVDVLGNADITGAWTKSGETWQTPTYNANWSGTTTFGTISGGLGALKYRKDAEDNLQVIGCFTPAAGAGSSVFNLPVGYRPAGVNWAFPVAFISSGGTAGNAWMYISQAGNLNINSQLGSSVTTGTVYTINAKIPLGNIS